MERHGSGDDGEMMSSGNKGDGCFCVEYSCFATVWGLCWVLVGYGSWFLFVFHFCLLFLVFKIGDRGAVVRFIGGLLNIHLRC